MPRRYLLFDSGCSACSSIAQQVEQESGGRLIARSLRDPEIRAWLDRIEPDWSFQPMLLEVESEGYPTENVWLFTDWGFRLKLLKELGPRRTWRVAQTLRAGTALRQSQARRAFLKRGFLGSVAFFGGLAFGLGWGQIPGRADAAPSSSDSGLPPGVERLSSKEFSRKIQSSAVQQTSQHFEIHDWNDGYRFVDQLTGRGGYVILQVPREGDTNTRITFVGISDPVPSGGTLSVVGQLAKRDQGSAVLHWFTPGGYDLATTTLTKGRAETVIASQTTVEVPDAGCWINLRCFASCLGNSGVTLQCGLFCASCAILLNPIACAACAICAGVLGVGCAVACGGCGNC